MSTEPPLVITGLDGLVAYAPHAIGFHPEDAVVVIPVGFNRQIPAARQDIDAALASPGMSADMLRRVYSRYEHPQIAVLAYTEDPHRAEQALSVTAAAMPANVTVAAQLQVTAEQWRERTSGRTGPVDSTASGQVAAELVLRGRQSPWSNQQELRQSFAPDQVLRDEVLAAAADNRDPSLAGERNWITHTVETAVTTQARLPDSDAARLLQDLDNIGLRDTAWATMTVDSASGHAALWKDLTRRAPERLRTPAAALTGFSYWLTGDGMQARMALEHTPGRETYTMARLLQTALHHAVPPECWARLPEQPAPTPQEARRWAAEVEACAPAPAADSGRDEHLSRKAPPGLQMRYEPPRMDAHTYGQHIISATIPSPFSLPGNDKRITIGALQLDADGDWKTRYEPHHEGEFTTWRQRPEAEMTPYEGPRQVADVSVNPAYQRRGVATSMWNYAKTLGLNPAHDTDGIQTPTGTAWAATTSPGVDHGEATRETRTTPGHDRPEHRQPPTNNPHRGAGQTP